MQARPAARTRAIPAGPIASLVVYSPVADPSLRMTRARTVPPRTFQDLIFQLQSYWSNQGCVILQPYDMEMGAGTFHTATFLRAVGT